MYTDLDPGLKVIILLKKNSFLKFLCNNPVTVTGTVRWYMPEIHTVPFGGLMIAPDVGMLVC